MTSERDRMECDVLVIGAGPAGLATAIRLKQRDPSIHVIVLEKGAEIGAHIVSGAVIDPAGIDALLPGWRDDADRPTMAPITDDSFLFLTEKSAIPLPHWAMPAVMSNSGNLVLSLADLTRYLGRKAEALGVEIYAGFPATDLLMDRDTLIGVVTGDMGRDADGSEGASFQPGIELVARYTVLAEGVRGSLTKQAIARFSLAAESPQKYGLGIKELWKVAPGRHRPGFVQHSFGWPLGDKTGGGSFLYHFGDGLVSVGLVVHLDYANPYLSPFEEFQRLKTHPALRDTFEGAERIGYGARAISEGGWQSVPTLAFPGGLLVGDAAGFMNLPRIKGSHNAIRSGHLAADHLADALSAGRRSDTLQSYDDAWRGAEIGRDLFPVRNAKPLWSRFGTLFGLALGGFDLWCNQLFGRSIFGTMAHRKADHEALDPAANHTPIAYPRPDNVLTFDRLSSLFVSGTSHRDGQPVHLKVADMALQVQSELGTYAGPSARYCPAAVYAWDDKDGAPRFTIAAQNCVHCKTCDIKDPNQNIAWVPPEGGGGPGYGAM